MGADQSKTPKSLSQSIDYLAANYILTSNFQDLKDLSDASSCKELVVLTSEVLDKYMTERDVSFLQQRLEGSVEKNYMTKKSLAYFNEEKLEDMDVKSDLQKKRMCLGIAKFYIRIFHVFNAIAHTVNPEYTWVDANGQSHTVGYEQKGEIPENVKYSLTKMNLCSEKMNALVDKTNLDIIIQDDNSKDIEIKPKFCGINLNESNGTANVKDEPGMPELEKLYYDQYNYATGKFQSMSPDMKEVYEEDVKTLYKAFAHDKKSMPSDITKFSDIQLRDFENIVQCQPNGVFTKAYSGSLKEKQFQEYADNIRLMKQNTKENQDALMKILDSLFAFTPDPQTKGKKMISIHPDLTEKTLDTVVEKTREAILKLYTTCEKDFYKGLQLFEAIVWKQMLDTSVKQIDNLKQDISNEMAADPDDVRNRGQPQPQYPGYMGLPNPNAAYLGGPATPKQGEPGNNYNNQQTNNIKQEPAAKKEEESESDSDSESESDDEKDDKEDKPYEKIVTHPQNRVNLNTTAAAYGSPIVPVARAQYNQYPRNYVDLSRPGPNYVHDIESKEVGIESPAAPTSVKEEDRKAIDSDSQQKGKEDSATKETNPSASAEEGNVEQPDKSAEDKVKKVKPNFLQGIVNLNLFNDEKKKDTPVVVLENTSNLYHEKQRGELCGMHVINNLFGKKNTVDEVKMKGYCKACATCLPDLTEEECKNPENIQQFCNNSGENFDIYVLIYAIMVMDDYDVSVLPHYFKDSIPNNCLKKYSDTINWIEWDNTIISNLLTNNVVGVIFRKTKGIHHYVAFKKTNYDKKKGATFTEIDSRNDDEMEYSQQALIDYLLRYDAYKNGCIIVNEKTPSTSSSTVDAEAEAEADVDAGEKDAEEVKVNIQDDTTETEESSNEEYQGDTTETEEGIESRQQNQGENTINAEKDGITEALKHTMRVTEDPTDKDGKPPQLTFFATNEGAYHTNAPLGDAFSTSGKSNKNTPSAKKTTAAEPKYTKDQKVVYTKDGISYYATIMSVHSEDAPNYYYTIKYKDGSDIRDEIQTDNAHLREINAADKEAMAKENARNIIENLKKAKETQNPPNVEDKNAQEKAKSKNTGTGIINTGIIKGIGNFFTGLVGSNPEDNTHTQKETEEQQAQKPADSAEPPGMVTRSQTNKRAQNPADSDSAKRSGNETPVVSDSASNEEDTLLASQYIQQQAQKPAETRMMTRSRSRANETETSQNNQPKTKASAPPNNDADVIVEDVDPLEEIKTDLENEGCDKFVIDSNYSLSHIDKCVNMLQSSITELEELHGNSNSSSTYKAKITNYLKNTIRPVKRKYLAQQTTRRNKNNIKGGARSRKKKHTKKHRKNSRRKTKSMKRVKKLKK